VVPASVDHHITGPGLHRERARAPVLLELERADDRLNERAQPYWIAQSREVIVVGVPVVDAQRRRPFDRPGAVRALAELTQALRGVPDVRLAMAQHAIGKHAREQLAVSGIGEQVAEQLQARAVAQQLAQTMGRLYARRLLRSVREPDSVDVVGEVG